MTSGARLADAKNVALPQTKENTPNFRACRRTVEQREGPAPRHVISFGSESDRDRSSELFDRKVRARAFTVPQLAAWTILYFMGEDAPHFSVAEVTLFTFLITTVPVLAGVLIRHLFTKVAMRIEKPLNQIAAAFWILLVAALFYGHRELLAREMPTLGLSLLSLPLLMVLLSLITGRVSRMTVQEAKTISIETSVQNAPLGLVLGNQIMGTTSGFSELALPSAVYSATMHMIIIPAILIFRRIGGVEQDVPQTVATSQPR